MVIPVARKLWQLTVGGSPAALARRLTIWSAICLFMRVPFRRDLVMSSAWNIGAFGVCHRPVASMYSPSYSTSLWRAGTWYCLPPFSCGRNTRC